MIRLILASNLASSSDALSSGWVSVFEIDGGVTVFIKYALMQLSFLPDYLDAYRGFVMLVGTLAVLCFFIGLFCRVMFGADDRSLIGRSFYACASIPVGYVFRDCFRYQGEGVSALPHRCGPVLSCVDCSIHIHEFELFPSGLQQTRLDAVGRD